MKDLWDRFGISGQRKSEGVPPPSPLSPSFSRVISLLSMASLFVYTLCTLSDASCSADQRDFCLKHDLSLKYLKPDYLWVCHLGRRDVTSAGQWQDPPLLSSLSPFFRQERRAYAGEIPRLWILSTNVKRSLLSSLPLSVLSRSVLFHRRRAPLECNEIWHVPFITADILLSFGHTFLAERSRVRNSFFLSLPFSHLFFTSLQRCYLQW